MKPPLYDDVHKLALDIVNASECGDQRAHWAAYNKLSNLCRDNERNEQNHPIQWEALGDFTTNSENALTIYSEALRAAERLKLVEYAASVKLAMAERHLEIGQKGLAIEFASSANELAASTEDLELRREISEFLLSASEDT